MQEEEKAVNNVGKSRYWARHIERFQSSGLSQTQYSRKYKVGRQRLYYWQKRLSDKGAIRQARSEKSGFVPVEVALAPRVARFRLSLPGGAVLEGEGLPDSRWVSSLVTGLREEQ